MPRKTALLIDGGHLRKLCEQQQKPVNDPDYIERVALACFSPGEEDIFRVFYYDCAPYNGTHKLPISAAPHSFHGADHWQHLLAQKNFFALRRGRLKFVEWQLKRPLRAGEAATDQHFKPKLQQKGVDMRIGLDMATLAGKGGVERVILLAADTDFIPAMKFVRTEGLQVVSAGLGGTRFSCEFLEHVDIQRPVAWP